MTALFHSYKAKKMIPLTGYIHNRDAVDNRVLVNGFAFQVSGFEWCHTWLTRGLDSWNSHRWMVSHWESGNFVGSVHGYRTRRSAMVQAKLFLEKHGEENVREKIAPWISTSSPCATKTL